MSFATETNIRQTFDGRLLEILPLLNLTQTDVAWENAKFKPRPSKIYLKCSLLPATPTNVTLGFPCFVRMSGVYQISIFYAKDAGLQELENAADIILREFPSGTELNCCGERLVINLSYRGRIQEEEARVMLPISLVYYCETYQKHQASGQGR